MRVLLVLLAYVAPLVLAVAAVVWAVNLSSSLHAIEKTLGRMEVRQAAVFEQRATATVPPQSTPIDVEPFVD